MLLALEPCLNEMMSTKKPIHIYSLAERSAEASNKYLSWCIVTGCRANSYAPTKKKKVHSPQV